MTQQTQPQSTGSGHSQSVSIAGGSLFLIGVMLWFFTNGVKSKVNELSKEVTELKGMLEVQGKALEDLGVRLPQAPVEKAAEVAQ